MTPGARVQAAIGILDAVFAGAPAERELTAWGRASRYAGSGDRAAVRDHVYAALRGLRSAAWAGGLGDVAMDQMQGRAVMAGLLRGQGVDPATLFTGQGHAPEPITLTPVPAAPRAVALDLPDWLLPMFDAGLGAEAEPTAKALRHRAPIFLRVNTARTDRASVLTELAAARIAAAPSPLAESAVVLDGSPRGVTQWPAYLDGRVELQDAGSQALVERLPITAGARILDLCAGGGGKALAMAARGAQVTAHDADPQRMKDLPARAARAGAVIATSTTPEADAPFDAVVADVPCSGTGSWRRAPEAKWRLTPARLDDLSKLQSEILTRAIALTRPGGWIAYMTCSVLPAENERIVDPLLSADVVLSDRLTLLPGDQSDGFHLSVLHKGR